MATIKSYTDISQSKKLAEILPIENADMHWQYIEEDNGQLQWFCFPKDFSINQHDNIRAWSLTALLSIIPNYKLSSEHNHHTCTAETSFGKETVAWFNNPVDACYEMILKLHELNLL